MDLDCAETPTFDADFLRTLTQEQLAHKAGIHRTYLADIERGLRNVSLINIERISAALSMQLSQLFKHV